MWQLVEAEERIISVGFCGIEASSLHRVDDDYWPFLIK